MPQQIFEFLLYILIIFVVLALGCLYADRYDKRSEAKKNIRY